MVSGTEKDREHWRFVSVQTRGCHSATRCSDKQREQQRQLAGYLAIGECEVVGMGDTRLGGDASDIARLARTALNGLYNDATITTAYDEAAGPADRVQSRSGAAIHDNDTNTVRGTRPEKDSVGHDVGATDPAEPDSNIYDDTNIHNNTNTNDAERDAQPPAAQSVARSRLRVGSHPCGEAACCLVRSARRTGAWRGASATADCRGWGRYVARIYRGASKKTMVVVETYFPGAPYEASDAAREENSQMLSARAAAAPPGVSAARWKRDAKPPKSCDVRAVQPNHLKLAHHSHCTGISGTHRWDH